MGSLKKLIQIGVIVLGSFALIWFPFIDPQQEFKSLKQVIFRIFPLARGVFEDKVANFWCSLNLFIKVKTIYSQEELMKICAIVTGFVVLPSNVHLFLRPNLRNFLCSLSVTSLGFFLFSFQVHEKSILLAVIPSLIWIYSTRRDSSNAHLIATWLSVISIFSMLPLLKRDGLTIPTLALTLLYIIISRAFEKPFYKVLDYTWNDFILRFVYGSSLLFVVGLTFAISFIPPPNKYPDLWPVIISLYSCVHFVLFLSYFYYYQFLDTMRVKQLN
ncbi:probable dolichyl pyrophosphate Man9GlcNAc2 alpha-1,3-glucosyltransferase [Lepeophtheirus salmonis]|uniref:probable dolichyl pyrophosphate Man9GlcNAc2 alpha-1,3-glucosyltransferase n=1 Tax=Lepeophtheirus salmonis TaxID=72036 RepID=UPI001AE9CBBA|nr:probable dolichyl pyrophosphate Man9GlcNAc2 alpha-1,3-glucosyltransferase [Lepeophtheirus salmonis]